MASDAQGARGRPPRATDLCGVAAGAGLWAATLRRSRALLRALARNPQSTAFSFGERPRSSSRPARGRRRLDRPRFADVDRPLPRATPAGPYRTRSDAPGPRVRAWRGVGTAPGSGRVRRYPKDVDDQHRHDRRLVAHRPRRLQKPLRSLPFQPRGPKTLGFNENVKNAPVLGGPQTVGSSLYHDPRNHVRPTTQVLAVLTTKDVAFVSTDSSRMIIGGVNRLLYPSLFIKRKKLCHNRGNPSSVQTPKLS